MIRLAAAIDFLSQVAPRPWVTRMLHAMFLTDELQPFFLSGRVRSEVMVAQILAKIENYKLEQHSAERDAFVREALGDELADLIKGKDWQENVVEYDEPIEPVEGYILADLGFIHYGAIDWQGGHMICEYIPERKERPEHLFYNIEEMISSEYESNTVTAEFRDMHLVRSKIELLLPSHRLLSGDHIERPAPQDLRRVGRPAKWDWEGALAHVVAIAQTPDGLPTGHGAQAKIETIMAEWFMAETGNSPSISQIRTRAALVKGTIDRPKA